MSRHNLLIILICSTVSVVILFREDYLNKPQTQQAVSYLQSRWGS